MDKLETAAVMAHGDGGADHVPHVLPLKAYFGVFGALLGLTALTVGVSYVDFGDWNIAVALAVAVIKATLVAAIFMHLAFDKKFNLVVFVLGIVFLVVFLGFTMADTENREVADAIEAQRPRDFTAPFANGKPDIATAAPAAAAGKHAAGGAKGAEAPPADPPKAGGEAAPGAGGADPAPKNVPATKPAR